MLYFRSMAPPALWLWDGDAQRVRGHRELERRRRRIRNTRTLRHRIHDHLEDVHLPARHVTLREDHDVPGEVLRDRKSTRLNSSHVAISYAVFCLKKKK